jgi:hypothetical protein
LNSEIVCLSDKTFAEAQFGIAVIDNDDGSVAGIK